ncbi:polysaccharide export protein [candidate division KSB1 bacterium]|nr:polysaccharide export protein [candidate division KSB1 bacterium]RQW01077.1 MAG: polysaccharide export protein [candidate division KSB1 bacterium]
MCHAIETYDVDSTLTHKDQTMKSRAYILFAAVWLLNHTGCSTHTRLKYQQESYSQVEVSTAETKKGSSNGVYTLGIDDVVEIKFFDNEQFNEVLRVRPDGRISLAKVGDIFVHGLTPVQLDSIITSCYAKIIQTPDVTVIVREFGTRQIFVLGQVNAPGGYPVDRNMTLLHILAAAGGLKDTAEPRSIMILRRKSRSVLAAYKIDVTQTFKQTQYDAMNADPFVYSMDIIYVPKTYIASASTFLRQIYDILLPPFDVYLRALWYSELTR